MTIRADILESANKIVNGERDKQYGKPEDNFRIISELWTSYLGKKITAKDVAMMMALLKIARIKTGDYKEDNYIDLAGYAACGAEIEGRNRNDIKASAEILGGALKETEYICGHTGNRCSNCIPGACSHRLEERR